MYVYIYIYIYNINDTTKLIKVKNGLKRVLDYGVRAPAFYGDLREKTVFHEYLQEACLVLTEIPGDLREFVGKCHLGIYVV